MKYKRLKNDIATRILSIWMALVTHIWLTVRPTVCAQNGHHCAVLFQVCFRLVAKLQQYHCWP